MKKQVFFCALVMAAAAHAEPFDASLAKDMPADVIAYLDRAGECWHWGGEEPYDAARAKEIEKAIKAQKCDALDTDEKALKEKYKTDKQVTSRLSKAKKLYE